MGYYKSFTVIQDDISLIKDGENPIDKIHILGVLTGSVLVYPSFAEDGTIDETVSVSFPTGSLIQGGVYEIQVLKIAYEEILDDGMILGYAGEKGTYR